MRLVITGAGGFLGAEIVRQAMAGDRFGELVLADRGPIAIAPRQGVRVLTGDLLDPDLLAAVLDGADAVIHLAAVLGGAAEQNPSLARRVNVDLPLTMIERLRETAARFVFASSIAVLGAPLPDPVGDDTPLAPVMLYGAHKAMIEKALAQAARRGWLEAVSLRPAGIVARDGLDASLKSAFLSRLFWSVARGEDVVLPVSRPDRTWLASVSNVAGNFLHAVDTADVADGTALTLPALAVTFGELADALRRRFPHSRSRIDHAPDAQTRELFGKFPPLETPAADAAGFSRDRDVDALIANALGDTP